MKVLHIYGKGMKELHSAGCTIYDIWQYCRVYDSTALYMTALHSIWQYCTLYDSTALHLTVLHSTALCGGCNCCVRGCTSSSVGLVTSTSSSQAQLSRVFTPRHRTLSPLTLRYIYTDIWAVQCGDLPLYTFTRIHSITPSYIHTTSWAVQWTLAISFTLYTFIRIRCILYMDNTDKRAVQWASAISFFPLRG